MPIFRVNLTGKSSTGIILAIPCHLQGQRSVPRAKCEVLFLSNTNSSKFFCVCAWIRRSIFSSNVIIQGHIQGQNENFKVK